jgi:putative ABC transport system permease protein
VVQLAGMQHAVVMLSGLFADIRDAFRSLRRSGAFAAWVVGSLAIGMAVAIAALALLNAALLLPFQGVTDQDRLVRVSVSENCGRPDCWRRMFSPDDYRALQEGLHSVQGLAAYSFGDVSAGVPDARLLRAIAASPNYFDVLGVRPALGRMFGAGDAATSAAVAVVGHAAWIRELGADPSVIGRSMRVGDGFVQIVGVAPPFFAGVDRTRPGTGRSMNVERGPDIWLPLWLADRTLLARDGREPFAERGVYFVGRLAAGADEPQVQAEAAVLARRLAATRSATSSNALADVRRVWRVNPGTWRVGAVVILPIPVLVLLIACVNAANLMTARGSQRQREIAIRLAIGAGRSRVIRLLLVESALLAAAATAIALPAARWGMQFASTPLGVPIPFDLTVLTLTVAAAALTTVAFGLAPAVRISAQRPSSTLGATGTRTDGRPGQSRARRVLVMAQVALSLGLLATAWQLVATVRGEAVAAGTAPDRLLLARFDLRPLGFTVADAEAFYRDLVVAARRLPGVEATDVARGSSVWTFGNAAEASAVTVWRDGDRMEEGQSVSGGYAGPDLFSAVGLRIVAGRGFTEADRLSRPQVAVVNETAARNLTGPAVGALVHVGLPGRPFDASLPVRVVGVVEASREPRLEAGELPAARMYLPSPLEDELALTAYVRTSGPATATAQPLRDLVARIAPRVPILELGSLEEFNERSYATQLWLARAAGFIGVIGLLLATAGLYGVTSYVVAMRSREIAIRMAIGARPQVILRMILGQSMQIALVGLVAGSGVAVAASRILQSEYHGVRGIDAAAYSGAAVLFLVAMLSASAVPARRASRVDPIQNLKDA